MKILGIDYGRRKIGLAFADGPLAEPWKVIKVNSFEDAVDKVAQVSKVSQVSKAVVGISEGKIGEESKKYSQSLSKKLNIPIETYDETLSTQDAQSLSKEAGIKRKKRREMEDAYAACIMLQNYLDGI